jgi:hypothetical protein
MSLTQHELELKTLAIVRIRQKVLPAQAPKSIWAGQGSGEKCSLCERTIEKTEMEYELDAPVSRTNRVIRLHLQCHALWQLELARESDRASQHD